MKLAIATGDGRDPAKADWQAWANYYGRLPHVGETFHNLGSEPLFWSSTLSGFKDLKITPNIALSPSSVTLAAVAAGQIDIYLENLAKEAVSFGNEIQIRLFHEFNGIWHSYGPDDASDETFIEAWKRIVSLFKNRGAINVRWVWCVNYWTPTSTTKPPFTRWPGNDYVDVIGWDGYANPRYPGSFDYIFAPNYQALACLGYATKKPIHVSETGNSISSQRADFYKIALENFSSKYPQVEQFSVFDRIDPPDDYTIDGSGVNQAARDNFRSLLQSKFTP